MGVQLGPQREDVQTQPAERHFCLQNPSASFGPCLSFKCNVLALTQSPRIFLPSLTPPLKLPLSAFPLSRRTPPAPCARFQSWWPPPSLVCLTKLSVAVCQSHVNSQPWGRNGAVQREERGHIYSGTDARLTICEAPSGLEPCEPFEKSSTAWLAVINLTKGCLRGQELHYNTAPGVNCESCIV